MVLVTSTRAEKVMGEVLIVIRQVRRRRRRREGAIFTTVHLVMLFLCDILLVWLVVVAVYSSCTKTRRM